MKWRGRRLSTNVEDQRDTDAIRSIIENSTVEDTYTGGVSPTTSRKKTKDTGNYDFDPNDKKEMEVVKELGKIHREKRTPVPTPKPKITHTQVTPGKWTTK